MVGGGWIGIGRRLLAASRWNMCNPCILWVDLNRVYIGVAWRPIVELALREGRWAERAVIGIG
jgi:hypothetical protein